MVKKDICILLFSRSTVEESLSKCFGSTLTPKQNVHIAKNLIGRSLAVIESTGLPFVHYTESKQHGENFGERISNAVRSVINDGFKRVLVVGNDCPTLTKEDLMHSAALLENGKTIVGPTNDGGAYIIGLQDASFNEKAFKELQWSTKYCFDSIIKHYADEDIEILNKRSDLNTLREYLTTLSIYDKRVVVTRLKLTFLGQVISENCTIINIVNNTGIQSDTQRGPPFLKQAS